MQSYGTNIRNPIGHPTVQITLMSKDNCQESLTKLAKKILNRDTYMKPIRMKLGNIGTGLAAAAALSMSGCANAQETTGTTAQLSDAVELTLTDCAAKTTEEAIDACLIAFDTQEQAKIASARAEIAERQAQLDANSAEIAARTGRVDAGNAEIAVLDQQVQQGNSRNDATQARINQGNTTNEVLSNEAEALRAEINQIFQEESEKGG